MKTVDIVIPVYNSVHWLSWCLEELFRFKPQNLGKVFVVNDRSEIAHSKKINEIISRHSNHIELIVNDGNEGGFGYACNLGASKCSSDVILFLNTDCLLTKDVVDHLLSVFAIDPQVALACPLSNNSANLTYPLLSGYSYRDMATLIYKASKESSSNPIVEACTVVGNCLMVCRDFFEKVNGFASEWGMGYGEETDLHMKALSIGLKGVVHTGCYVYHYGGGTFNYKSEIELHKEKNYQLFMSKWAKEYNELSERCKSINPVKTISENLNRYALDTSPLELDVLFYLPGVDQGIGGVNAVIAICNELIKKGVKASIALISGTPNQLESYQDPVLFNFIYFDSNESFLEDRRILPKIVFSTIVWSAPIVSDFAKTRNAIAAQFVQGYEGFFWNGTRYAEAIDSYKTTSHLVTTSEWLFKMVKRHLSDHQNIQQLPLVVNSDIFFPTDLRRPIDIIIVFRSSPDKGQWILAELLDRLSDSDKSIIVLCASDFSALASKYKNQIEIIDLPIDQYRFAETLRRGKVLVDASFHEGYGLIPLEAAKCGCDLVLSDSGGIRDFVHQYNGELISNFLDFEKVVQLINQKLDKFNSKEVKTSPETQIYSGEAWYKYFQKVTQNTALPFFEQELPIENELILTNNQRISEFIETDTICSFDNISDEKPIQLSSESVEPKGITKKLYKLLIFPYIPKRLHLALKMLISGKS